jgi:hypothetical protein
MSLMAETPNAEPFTSILNIDAERELGEGYAKGRLHVRLAIHMLASR